MMEIDLSVLVANTLVQFFSGWLGRYRGRYILYFTERWFGGDVWVVTLDLLLALVVALLLIVALLLLAVARRVDGDHWRW